jgi:type IV secretion system protein VirB9
MVMHAMKKHTRSITAWLTVALLCSGASSQAAEVPAPGDGDQRVRYVTYQKD